jgi:zinc/manganese transport system substrate-binding protein
MRRWRDAVRGAAVVVAVMMVASGCNSSSPASGSPGKVQVVAAENFWGSIAEQLGGDRVQVTSVITDPATDPHDYEPTPADGREMAGSQLAIVNGIGYDAWAMQLLDANPAGGRVVLNVGDLLGVAEGGNPHRWYSPPDVQQVIDQIVADYKRLDPKHASYFDLQKQRFESHALAAYTAEISLIKGRYAGTPVGASESIFAPMADALGLRLLTPASFLNAISEGTEPTPQDKAAVDQQIATGQIKVWVFNSQNSTPDVARLTDAARSHHIPIATVTETLTPAGASFEQWQTRQLEALAAALAKATGR